MQRIEYSNSSRAVKQGLPPQGPAPWFRVTPWLLAGCLWLGGSGLGSAAAERPDPVLFNAPPEPEVGDPGGRGRGGGSRNDACKAYADLTALVPQTSQGKKEKVWGMTSQSHPTFWFYLPVPLERGSAVQFTLVDGTGRTVYNTRLQPQPTPAGIIHISVPSTAPALQVKQAYRWGLSINCQTSSAAGGRSSRPLSDVVSVRGMIYRTAIAEDLQRRIQRTPSPLARAQLYAQNGIWFEALTLLGQAGLGQTKPASSAPQPENAPAEIREAWSSLLRQGNVASVLSAPLVPCCIPPVEQTSGIPPK
jgi:hypothetical protein